VNAAFLCLLSAFAAGVASTLLELGWLRAAAAALPGTLPAAALVLPVFLAAWSAGSMWAGRLQDRCPLRLLLAARWLAAAALAVLAVPALLAWMAPSAGEAGPWARLARGGLPVVPAALLLGGALPLFARLRLAAGLPSARATGAVAAAVALGGAVGTQWYLPLLAAGNDPALVAALCLAAGAVLAAALHLFEQDAPAVDAGARSGPEASAPVRGARLTGLELVLAAALGGALLVGGQLAMLRVAAQVGGESLATTTGILFGVHLGMAAGALCLAATWRGLAPRALVALLLALAAGALLQPALQAARLADADPAGLSLLFTLPLGFGAGSLVTAASRAAVRAERRLGSWVGDLGAWSTAGGIAGSVLYGAWLAPAAGIGTGRALHLLSAAGLVVGLWLAASSWCAARRGSSLLVAVVLLGGVALAWRTPPLELPWRRDALETQLLAQREGPYGVVSLVATADGETRLKLDNRFGLGGTGASGAWLEQRLGRIAASLHPGARRALLLGLGRGQTLAGLAGTSLAHVDCVEHNAQILALDLPLPFVEGTGARGGPPAVRHADARAWVEAHPATYDLIVGDLFYPWVSGAGDLLALEQFRALRAALVEGGVVVQWLPLHQLPWPAFASVATAFSRVFPTARLLVATPLSSLPLVALVGGLDQGLPGMEAADALLAGAVLPCGPNSARELLDLVLTDAWGLESGFGGAAPTTRAWPRSELLSLRRERDEASIAATNTRLLAELVVPLDTSALTERPHAAKENRRLGVELQARAQVLADLLRARAAALTLALEAPQGEALRELDAALAGSLLRAWTAMPGHPDVRTALLERVQVLLDADRALDAGGLLEQALRTSADGTLGGVLGGVFLRLQLPEQALAMLRQAEAVAPDDRSVLMNLSAALLFTGDDGAARARLLRAADVYGPRGLPALHATALALLQGESGAREQARELLTWPELDAGWRACLERLLARGATPGER